jgi:N-sulfoglucosamine sulfohydrolase
VRALQTKDFLYIHNFNPERWPAGNPETDFGNLDPSPSKEYIKFLGGYYYDLSLGKRLPDELYDLRTDPEGVHNLANDLAYMSTLETMRTRMMKLLVDEKDPRALGQAAVFDTYKYVGGRTKGYETWLKAQEAKVNPVEGGVPDGAAKKAGKKKKAANPDN